MKKICQPIVIAKIHFSICGLMVIVLMVTVLCALGFWQLGRAEEKKLFLARQQQADQEAVNLNALQSASLADLEYKTVTVTGHYDDSRQILINNQIKQGKVGYFVLTPLFISQQNNTVLVNRGWVAKDLKRSTYPDVSLVEKTVTLKGRVNHFPSVGLILEGADEPTQGWPTEVQVINVDKMSAKLDYRILDFQIELSANQSQGYLRNWTELRIIPPEKHIAYAVQWFALALTLIILYVWYSVKRK